METELALPEQINGDLVSDRESFEVGQRVAKLFAASELIPQHMRGKVADVFAAMTLARAMGLPPLVVMQNMHSIGGKSGWLTQFVIARANTSGVFAGPINWRVTGAGKDMAVTAYATLAATGEQAEATVTMAMAEAEGWTRNKKYATMPEHMLRFRSAAFLVRLYAPQILLGYHTTDELVDMSRDEREARREKRTDVVLKSIKSITEETDVEST